MKAGSRCCPAAEWWRSPKHNAPETRSLTDSPLRPKIGITGLLNLLAWVEQKRVAHAAQQKEGGVSCPVPHPPPFPPPTSRPHCTLWEQLPPPNRQRLLGLLSRLIERQLEPRSTLGKEGSDDCDSPAG
jgi:hypothetical protein